MPVVSDPKFDEAVAMGLKDDLKPRTAWELAGKPGGEKSIQNIRKRMREERAKAASPTPGTPEPVATSQPTTTSTVALPPGVPQRRNNEQVSYRRNSAQVDKDHDAQQLCKRKYIDALKGASAEFQKAQMTGAKSSAAKLASAFNTQHQLGTATGTKELTGKAVWHHYNSGFAGLSPPGKGPRGKHALPNALVKLVSSHASMSQLNGDEKDPRAITRTAMALVKGTKYEKHLSAPNQKRRFLTRLRQDGLNKVPKQLVDNRRWMFLTYANVDRYFDGWKAFLLSEGFAEDEPCMLEGGVVSEVTFHDYSLPRLSNGDETHQQLSNACDKSGTRATTFIDPRIPRSGSRKVECAKHTTVYVIINGADEVGTFTAIFDTTASEAEDRRIHASWTAGLPRVQAKWGHAETFIHEPVVLVTPNGGTSKDALEMILEAAIIPLYPNLSPTWKFDEEGNFLAGPVCHRLDGGPGRTGQASLPMRMRMAEKGVFLFPSGPQNCTAACQEADQLFGDYKEKCDDVTDDIVAERIAARAKAEAQLRKDGGPADRRRSCKSALPKVELTNADLPRVINGRPDDPIEKCPFSYAFTKEKVHKANANVGAVPLTRAALRNPKVRKELEAGEQASGIVGEIVQTHDQNLADCNALGLNTVVAEVKLPRRYDIVAPPTAEEEVIQKLVESKATHTSMWINCGAVPFNGAVMNKAGVAMAREALDKKADAANATLSGFVDLKAKAHLIWQRMYDEEIGSYGELEAGEPKLLVQFWHRAKGEKGIGKYSSVKDQVKFLSTIEDDDFEELFKLEQPSGFKAIDHTEEVAAKLLTDMSKSMRQTVASIHQPEREQVLALTGLNGAIDDEEEDPCQTVSAERAGFESSLLPPDALLYKVPPSEAMLKFESEGGTEMVGLEIVRNFKGAGWCIGRILKQATDASVKDSKRICNFRVFYEADDEFINQSLYATNYAKGASSAIGTWMLIGSRSKAHPALAMPLPALALMPPQ